MISQKVKQFALVFSLFATLTLILTYPAVFQLTTHFMGDGGDALQNVWNMWWMKKVLTGPIAHPYYTNYLHHPEGVTLLFQTLNPFNGLISIPLQFIFKMEVVYNLIVLFSFVMSGVTMYYLALYLTGHTPAALIAGTIFTFCPYHFAHGLGHLQLIAMEWIPLYVLYLLKTYNEGSMRNAVWAGIFLILTTMCSWYYLIYCLLFTIIFVVHRLLANRKKVSTRGFLQRLGLTLLVSYICMAPLLGAMTYTKLSGKFAGQHDPETFSADLTSFFIPSGVSTWGQRWFENVWSKWSGNTPENSNYLGYIVLTLSIYAVVRIPACRFWAIAGTIFWLLALGPYLRVMGNQISLPLPYLLLHNYVPFFSFMGVPERFDIMLKFCMAIMGGFGVLKLFHTYSPTSVNPMTNGINMVIKPAQENKGNRETPHRLHIVVAVIGILICIEYLALPFKTTQVDVPQFYKVLAKDTDKYAVIDIPLNTRTLYFATIHEKPIVGGYVSRPPWSALNFLRETPIISTLVNQKPAPQSEHIEEALENIVQSRIRYIITHNDEHKIFLENILMLEKIYNAEGINVYDCRKRNMLN